MKKVIYIAIGFISLFLGILGIFLPVLPTTPFLLLSAFLFSKSSDIFFNKLISHPKLGPYILDFQVNKSIPLRTKIISVSTLWATILFSVFYILKGKIILQSLLLAIAVGVTIHILSFKTKKQALPLDRSLPHTLQIVVGRTEMSTTDITAIRRQRGRMYRLQNAMFFRIYYCSFFLRIRTP